MWKNNILLFLYAVYKGEKGAGFRGGFQKDKLKKMRMKERIS
jgi:hypothetical protein